MKYKTSRELVEWWELDPKLKLILADVDYWLHARGSELVLTSIIRSSLEQEGLYLTKRAPAKTSVHMYGRGADARILRPDALNWEMIEYVNDKFPYDPLRPHLKTVIRHGGTADHLHFQVMAQPASVPDTRRA